MSMRLRIAFGAAAIIGALALLLMSLADGPQTLDERAQSVAETLKCPVCHDLSVADSPAPVAQEMRNQIRRELAQGRTPDQIRAEFVAAYGEWILIAPPRKGINWVAWLGPLALAVAGGAALVLVIATWARRRGPVIDIAARDPDVDALLAQAAARFGRELE